jgi:hypothetical protein
MIHVLVQKTEQLLCNNYYNTIITYDQKIGSNCVKEVVITLNLDELKNYIHCCGRAVTEY